MTNPTADFLPYLLSRNAEKMREKIHLIENWLDVVLDDYTITPTHAEDAVEVMFDVLNDLHYFHDVELALCEYKLTVKPPDQNKSFEIKFEYRQSVNGRLSYPDSRAFAIRIRYQGDGNVTHLVPPCQVIPSDYFDDLEPTDPKQNDFLRGVRWFAVDLNDVGLAVTEDTTEGKTRTVVVERHPVEITITINLDHQRLAFDAFNGVTHGSQDHE